MKKGFTLIELLAVVVIMGIVFGLVTTNIIRIISKSADKQYEILSTLMEKNAKLWVESNQPTELDTIGGTYCVTLQNLSDEGLVDLPLVDPRDDSEFTPTTCTFVQKMAASRYYYKFNDTSTP